MQLSEKVTEALVTVGLSLQEAQRRVKRANGSEQALTKLVDTAIAEAGDWQVPHKPATPKRASRGSQRRPKTPTNDAPQQNGNNRRGNYRGGGTPKSKKLDGWAAKAKGDDKKAEKVEASGKKAEAPGTKAPPTKLEASPTKSEASPTKSEASPSKLEASPTKLEAAPTKSEAAPTKSEAAPIAKLEAAPESTKVSNKIVDTEGSEPAAKACIDMMPPPMMAPVLPPHVPRPGTVPGIHFGQYPHPMAYGYAHHFAPPAEYYMHTRRPPFMPAYAYGYFVPPPPPPPSRP